MRLSRFRMLLDFPLLQRELTQIACRRRTYFLRCLVAGLMLMVLFVNYQAVSRNAGDAITVILGRGTDLAGALLMLCLWMIYLLLPAMSCSAISSEREKQTLGLILISRVTPARLVLEKFLGRLLPMLALLSLTAPLLGVAYAMGGFSVTGIAAAVTLLFVACLQIISAGIMWSSLLKGSMQAFWCTYLTLIAMLAVPLILYYNELLPANGILFGLEGSEVAAVFYIFLGYGLEVITGRVSMSGFLYSCLPPVSLSILMVVVSGMAISRWRMEAPLGNSGTSASRNIRHFSAWMLRLPWQILRAVLFRKQPARAEANADELSDLPARPLPNVTGIGWRETASSPLTRLPSQGLILLLILLAVVWLGSDDYVGRPGNVLVVHFCLMLVSVLLMLSICARTFTSERERETLELLLTTPLSTVDLLQEKLAAAMRIRSFLLFLFGTLIVIRLSTASSNFDSERSIGGIGYAVSSMLYTFLHLTFCMWTAVMFSLMFKTQMKAMIASLLSVIGVCFGFVICLLFLSAMMSSRLERLSDTSLIWAFISPFFVYIANETNGLSNIRQDIAPAVLVGTNLLWYSLIVSVLRIVVRLNAGNWLNRADEEEPFSTRAGILNWSNSPSIRTEKSSLQNQS